MTLRKLLAVSALLLPLMASAHNFVDGQRVAPVGIADRGELILNNNKFSYKNWNSSQLAGKVRVIVNTDDAIPGSGMFVRSSIESNKQLYPWSQFIVDSNGLARKAWQLDEGSSAIVVLDKDGRVQWAKDGALTQQEVQQVVGLLHKLLNK